MLLPLSSLLLSFIIYHTCCDDENSVLTQWSDEEENVCRRSGRRNWDSNTVQSKEKMSYGTWTSPIQSSMIAENILSFMEIRLDEHGYVYWLENRPTEGGRYVIRSNKQSDDIIPRSFNSRTRVHEYGGGSYIVGNDMVYFINFLDQRIYRQNLTESGSTPVPITNESTKLLRYADLIIDSFHQQLICVHEDHTNETNVQNTIASIPLKNTSSIITLDSGYDFYSSPRLSPDGRYLLWICWNNPNMPWDETELWIGELSDDDSVKLINKRRLFENMKESIVQPRWSSDGKYIYFISDRSNWWNIYRTTIDGHVLEHMHEMEAEFGAPQWMFGTSYYDFDSNGNIVAMYWKDGFAKLCRIDIHTKTFTPITATNEYTDIRYLRVHDQVVYFIGSSVMKPTEVVGFNLKTNVKTILACATNMTVDTRYISIPESIKFKTGDDHAYGFYYPPKNDDYLVSEHSDELPPLLVLSHGGPTSATTTLFNLRIQYWTSRGFAVLDVNYRGSSGYGRKFRDSLKNNWGLYDMQDCVAGAEHLVSEKKADRKRLAIAGGSAGGYTTLCALTMSDYFSVGASHYGVSDLERLATDTHKFEARYLDLLVGEYPAKKDIYIQRSPITHAENLSKPIIFFQGTEDKVVLPNQAELMVNILRKKKLPVAYILFEGEQHGFLKFENIRKSLDWQFYFFSKIFKFEMADTVEPITIENFESN